MAETRADILRDDNLCYVCHARNMSLYQARHKDLGTIWICQQCWVQANEKNELVSGSGASGCGCVR